MGKFSLKSAVGAAVNPTGAIVGAVGGQKLGFLANPVGGAINGIAGLGGGDSNLMGPKPPTAPDLSKPGTPEEIKALQARLDAIQGPQSLSAEGLNSGYQAKKFDGPLEEFDYARRKATESANTEKQGNQEALARRFAALGGGMNSGAYIKQAEIQGTEADKNLGDQIQGIGAQEAQAKRALTQAEDTKVYQSQEAIRGRNAQREQYNADSDWKNKVFRFDSGSKLAQMDLAFQQSELDRRMNQYNAELSAYQAQNQGGLLGAGGFLGSGIHI